MNPPEERSIQGILVQGDPAFVRQVERALALIAADTEALGDVRSFIGVIRQSRRSGIQPAVTPSTLSLADPTTFASATWCASAIVHDAHHARLYLTHPRFPVPAEAWTGTRREIECIRKGTDFLIRIGAPAHEIRYSLGLLGTHADVDGDGDYDRADFEARDW